MAWSGRTRIDEMRAKCGQAFCWGPTKLLKGFGGPGRDRTDDLFHAMENQQLTAQTAKEL